MFRILPFLRFPLFWGGMLFVAFYGAIHRGILTGGLVERYFASHPVEYISTGLFFVGMAALVLKAIDVAAQRTSVGRIALPAVRSGGQSVDDAPMLLDLLARLPASMHETYLVRRLREAIELVRRKGTAETLDDHIRYLADVDFQRMHASYALVRIVVWAIPILGFLGTVIGITLAIAKLSPEALETSLPEVTGGLGVAFDTTALALALSIVLMFSKFFIERFEGWLLNTVDERTADQLIGRFRDEIASGDPNVAVVRRMAEAVMESTEQLVARQAQLWHATIDAARTEWTELTRRTGHQLEASLAGAISSSLREHAEAVATAESTLAAENHRHWHEVQQALVRSTGHLTKNQSELVRQGQILKEVVDATGQIQALERTLNDNLSSLAGSRNFEETVMSLAAAIQLLSARLGHGGTDESRVRLPSNQAAPSAA